MGIALATPAGLIVDANPALAAMLAYTSEELYGRSMLDLVHPDNRQPPSRRSPSSSRSAR
jgi:PAS fold.